MTDPQAISTSRLVRPALAAALTLAACGVFAPATSAMQATADAVVASADLDKVLEHARTAARRDAWSALEHGLRLGGTTDLAGMDADFELFFAPDGRYRYDMDGGMARTVAFDGRDVALRERAGPTVHQLLGDREGWHYSEWIHSGYWLEDACPIRTEVLRMTEDAASVALMLPDSTVPAMLVLDRETWLPRELRMETLGTEAVLSFSEYELVEGIPIAHKVVSSAAGQVNELRVLDARPASADPGSRYVAPAQDVHFDPTRAADVELKRVPSGHLLVHPLIEGRDMGWFILDSGAGQNCIDPTVADALDLDAFGSVPAVGVAGTVLARFRQGHVLELGPMRLDDPVYVELDLSFLAPVFGVEVAGICGYDVFARSVVELDLAETTLALYDPNAFQLGAGDWGDLALDGGVPSVRCRFEGDREGMFKLDLGDSGGVSFYSPAVEAYALLDGREVTSSRVGGVGGSGRAFDGTIDWFEVGGRRVENPPATFSQAETGVFASSVAVGNLGTLLLSSFRLVFDYPHGRMAFVPLE
jgi:hypothetical protein